MFFDFLIPSDLIHECMYCGVRFSNPKTLQAHITSYCSKKPATELIMTSSSPATSLSSSSSSLLFATNTSSSTPPPSFLLPSSSSSSLSMPPSSFSSCPSASSEVTKNMMLLTFMQEQLRMYYYANYLNRSASNPFESEMLKVAPVSGNQCNEQQLTSGGVPSNYDQKFSVPDFNTNFFENNMEHFLKHQHEAHQLHHTQIKLEQQPEQKLESVTSKSKSFCQKNNQIKNKTDNTNRHINEMNENTNTNLKYGSNQTKPTKTSNTRPNQASPTTTTVHTSQAPTTSQPLYNPFLYTPPKHQDANTSRHSSETCSSSFSNLSSHEGTTTMTTLSKPNNSNSSCSNGKHFKRHLDSDKKISDCVKKEPSDSIDVVNDCEEDQRMCVTDKLEKSILSSSSSSKPSYSSSSSSTSQQSTSQPTSFHDASSSAAAPTLSPQQANDWKLLESFREKFFKFLLTQYPLFQQLQPGHSINSNLENDQNHLHHSYYQLLSSMTNNYNNINNNKQLNNISALLFNNLLASSHQGNAIFQQQQHQPQQQLPSPRFPNKISTVSSGTNRCVECNIVFFKVENYLAHKQHYCASRNNNNIINNNNNNNNNIIIETNNNLVSADVNASNEVDARNVASSLNFISNNQLNIKNNMRNFSKRSDVSNDNVQNNNSKITKKIKISHTEDQYVDTNLTSNKMTDEEVDLEDESSKFDLSHPNQTILANRTSLQHFCIPCKIRFSSIETLKAHKKFYCSSRFDNSNDNEDEEMGSCNKTTAGDSGEDRPVISCGLCGQIFQNEQSLLIHFCTGKLDKQAHLDMYRCPHCDYVAQSENRLIDHARTHHIVPAKVYRCLLCGYRGNTVRGMRMHGKMHNDAGETFTDDSMLEVEEIPAVNLRKSKQQSTHLPQQTNIPNIIANNNVVFDRGGFNSTFYGNANDVPDIELIRMKNEPYKRRRSRKAYEKIEYNNVHSSANNNVNIYNNQCPIKPPFNNGFVKIPLVPQQYRCKHCPAMFALESHLEIHMLSHMQQDNSMTSPAASSLSSPTTKAPRPHSKFNNLSNISSHQMALTPPFIFQQPNSRGPTKRHLETNAPLIAVKKEPDGCSSLESDCVTSLGKRKKTSEGVQDYNKEFNICPDNVIKIVPKLEYQENSNSSADENEHESKNIGLITANRTEKNYKKGISPLQRNENFTNVQIFNNKDIIKQKQQQHLKTNQPESSNVEMNGNNDKVANSKRDATAIIQLNEPTVQPDPAKYCKQCNINFMYASTYLAHKKYYCCQEQDGKVADDSDVKIKSDPN
ncbi:hypothetical protein HELRODRAFT_188015 [Helobdella robusta]|uniref:C2H2-type domain-containing protein n=1 Tax=Helobdella robusta TaxID=6412 RepID=T1FPJ8_HELRO|nr:hypothetical protein HELRODRAFT_188015 [Helobdella robusta]ESO12862.1 hypothetical protein HELRODRAFT_188015 [Helobdella robusta]